MKKKQQATSTIKDTDIMLPDMQKFSKMCIEKMVLIPQRTHFVRTETAAKWRVSRKAAVSFTVYWSQKQRFLGKIFDDRRVEPSFLEVVDRNVLFLLLLIVMLWRMQRPFRNLKTSNKISFQNVLMCQILSETICGIGILWRMLL